MDFINMEKSHIISGTPDGVRSMREGATSTPGM
jgi:hypothetical protein